MWYTFILAVKKSCWQLLLLLYIISLLYVYNNYPYFSFSKYVCQTHVVWLQFGQRGCDSCCVHVVTTVWCRCRAAKSSEWRARHRTLEPTGRNAQVLSDSFCPFVLKLSFLMSSPSIFSIHSPTHKFLPRELLLFFRRQNFQASPTRYYKKTTITLNRYIILLFL